MKGATNLVWFSLGIACYAFCCALFLHSTQYGIVACIAGGIALMFSDPDIYDI